MVKGMRIFHLCATAAVVTAVFAVVCVVRTKCGVPLPVYADMTAAEPEIKPVPLGDDELSALRWLDYVTGELPKREESEWWSATSVQQFGLFAKRYNIAFAGYAAAALGMRGNCAEKAIVGRILGNCIGRMLRRDVWMTGRMVASVVRAVGGRSSHGDRRVEGVRGTY